MRKDSRPERTDICTMKSTGNSTTSRRNTAPEAVHAPPRLFNVVLPPGHAQDAEAHSERGYQHHYDDRARVADIGVREALQIGVEVRDLGGRPRPAARHDENMREGLHAVDESEQRSDDEGGLEEGHGDVAEGLPAGSSIESRGLQRLAWQHLERGEQHEHHEG